MIAYGAEHGWPVPGSPLNSVFDVLFHSNQFWPDKFAALGKSKAYTIGIIWTDALTTLVDLNPIVGAVMSTIAIIAIDDPVGDT